MRITPDEFVSDYLDMVGLVGHLQGSRFKLVNFGLHDSILCFVSYVPSGFKSGFEFLDFAFNCLSFNCINLSPLPATFKSNRLISRIAK